MAVQSSKLKAKTQAFIEDVSLGNAVYGKRIYILGSAEFGPTNEPKRIRSSIGMANTFGTEGTLINAFHALKYTLKNNEIYAVKTTGQHAIAYLNFNLKDGEIFHEAVSIIGKDSNEIYNDIIVRPDIDKIEIYYPMGFGDYTLSYYFEDYPTINELSKAINKDADNGKGYVYLYYTIEGHYCTENAFFTCNESEVYLYGGQCGLHYTKNLLYNCLEDTYSILESEKIDILVPVDAFIDDIYPNDRSNEKYQYGEKYYQKDKDYLTDSPFGKQLSFLDQAINFCARQSFFGIVTYGVMGFNSTVSDYDEYLYSSDELCDAYIASLNYNLACCENPDYAFLVSVVAGDIQYNHGTVIDNGYLAFAAALASSVVTDGITNKQISNTISLYNEFSQDILLKLSDMGITCFRQSIYYNQPVVYEAVTVYSKNNSGFHLAVNVRMIEITVAYVNELFQYYIGENIVKLIKDGVLKDNLNYLLSTLQSKGILTKFNFIIVPNYSLHKVKVYLTLETIFTVKAITLCSEVSLEIKEF